MPRHTPLSNRDAQVSTGLKAFLLFVAGLASSTACMAGEVFVCPATVRLASATVAPEDIPAGYEAWVSDSIIRLSGNNLYEGPPKYMAQLKPELSKGNVTTWMLHPGKYPQGVWVSCDYAGGLVTIASRVSDSATSCVATTERVKPHNTLAVRFVCKGEK